MKSEEDKKFEDILLKLGKRQPTHMEDIASIFKCVIPTLLLPDFKAVRDDSGNVTKVEIIKRPL